MTKNWWISTEKFTIQVTTVDGIITEAAPIARRFRGQKLMNLLRWAAGFPGFKYQDMDTVGK